MFLPQDHHIAFVWGAVLSHQTKWVSVAALSTQSRQGPLHGCSSTQECVQAGAVIKASWLYWKRSLDRGARRFCRAAHPGCVLVGKAEVSWVQPAGVDCSSDPSYESSLMFPSMWNYVSIYLIWWFTPICLSLLDFVEENLNSVSKKKPSQLNQIAWCRFSRSQWLTLAVALAIFSFSDFPGSRARSWVVFCLQAAANVSGGVSSPFPRNGASEYGLGVEQPVSWGKSTARKVVHSCMLQPLTLGWLWDWDPAGSWFKSLKCQKTSPAKKWLIFCSVVS